MPFNSIVDAHELQSADKIFVRLYGGDSKANRAFKAGLFALVGNLKLGEG